MAKWVREHTLKADYLSYNFDSAAENCVMLDKLLNPHMLRHFHLNNKDKDNIFPVGLLGYCEHCVNTCKTLKTMPSP